VELRQRNLITEGDLLSVGTPLPKGVTIEQVVKACAEKAGWQHTNEGWIRPGKETLGQTDSPHLMRGIGFACGYKNIGFSYGFPENCNAVIELHGRADGTYLRELHAG